MMVVVQERFYLGRVRLFRWNEKVFKNKVSASQGLALFVITSSFKALTRHHPDLGDEIQLGQRDQQVVPFDLSDLVAKEENLGRTLVRRTQQFLSNTVETLGEQISNYVFTRFQIDTLTILRPNSPKIVIVVHVARLRAVFFDRVEDHNIRISQFLPPEILPPRWDVEVTDEDEDEDDVEITDEDEDEDEDKNDPSNRYANDILFYLCGLRSYLGLERGWRTRRPLSMDEPRGFVEISPIVIVKPKEEFDKKVDKCAICLDGFVSMDDGKISTTSCFHVFHKHCILRWLLRQNFCPTCRLVVPLGFDISR